MGKPSNTDQRVARDEVNQGVKIIDKEHDDGSENPKTVVLENTHKKASSGQVQMKPSVNHKQSEDVSLEKEQCEIEVVAIQSAQRHSSRDGMDYNYGGEKFLRANVSDAFNSGEKHGPESVMKQGASIASNASIDKAVVNMADDKKTFHEFEDPSKNATPTSPRQPRTLTPNFKKDQKQEASVATSRDGVDQAVVSMADDKKTCREFEDPSKNTTPTSPRHPPSHTQNFKKDQKQEAGVATSRDGVDQAVVSMADDKKTCREFEDPSKNTTPTSPRQPPSHTQNFKKDQKQEAGVATSRDGVDQAVVNMADDKKTCYEFEDPSKNITPTSPRHPPSHTQNFKKDQISQTDSTSAIEEKFSANSSWRKATVTSLTRFIDPVSSAFGNLGDFGFADWMCLILPLCLLTSVGGFSTYEPGCSVVGSRRDDGVLDAFDVIAGLDTSQVFSGSDMGYNQTCSNAFHDADVSEVYLSNNSLSTLPNDIFHHTSVPVERVDISDNNFGEFPSALNSSNHVIFLNVSKNMIKYIPGGTMNGMEGLSTIDFSWNEAMEQVPEDTFRLMKHSLISVILTKTKVQHPLVPPPKNIVCPKHSPCIVTHGEGYVSIETNGSQVTFLIETVACEGVKQQLEAYYDILEDKVSCENNVLIGFMMVVRKDVSDAGTTYGPNQPDLTTFNLPSTDILTDLSKTEILTAGIDQDTGEDTTPSSVGEQSDLTNGTIEVPTKDPDQGISLSKAGVVVVVFIVFVIGVVVGAFVMGCYCHRRASSKMRPVHTTNGTLGGNPSDQPHTQSPTPPNIAVSQV